MPTDLKSDEESYKWPSTVWPSKSCATLALILDFMATGIGALLQRASALLRTNTGQLPSSFKPNDPLKLQNKKTKKTSVTNPRGGPSDAVDDVFGSTVRAGTGPRKA